MREQGRHFALQYGDMQARMRDAEKRGFDNGVLFEVGRITDELDRLRSVTGFGKKPGYRQGFIGCWSLARGIVRRGADPSRDTS
jgi:hypothetical protein